MITIEYKGGWEAVGACDYVLYLNGQSVGGCYKTDAQGIWTAYCVKVDKSMDGFASLDEAKAWVERWLKRYCKRRRLKMTKDGHICYDPSIKKTHDTSSA